MFVFQNLKTKTNEENYFNGARIVCAICNKL